MLTLVETGWNGYRIVSGKLYYVQGESRQTFNTAVFFESIQVAEKFFLWCS